MTAQTRLFGSALGLAALGWCALPSAAQAEAATVAACNSRESLELALSSPGAQLPEDCRRVRVRTLDSTNGRLCFIDPSTDSSGIVGAITAAATPDKWWVRCDSLRDVLN